MMECNKDEAIRAKEIAEQRILMGDYEGALKIAHKAQRLFPELDNILLLLTVCKVHCSARNKLNGSEMDWYGILQIEQFSDENIIKKQFRKLALSLHPDKNKLAGAEAAFKLIGEAHRVLTDQEKRSLYDMKCRAQRKVAPNPPCNKFNTTAPKPPSNRSSRTVPKASPGQSNSTARKPPVRTSYANKHCSIPNVSSQFMTSNAANQQSQQPSFWTYCTCCGIRYQYPKACLDRLLQCQNCKSSFIAHDLFPQGVSRNQRDQGWYKVPSQVNGEPVVVTQKFSGSDAMADEKYAAGAGKKVDGNLDAKAEKKGLAVRSESATKRKRGRKPSEEEFIELSEKQYSYSNVSFGFWACSSNQQASFWTYCTSCGIRYDYNKACLERLLQCESCKAYFIAHDLGCRGCFSGEADSE